MRLCFMDAVILLVIPVVPPIFPGLALWVVQRRLADTFISNEPVALCGLGHQELIVCVYISRELCVVTSRAFRVLQDSRLHAC